MPIVDGSLKQQIFEIENKMAKRVEDVILSCAADYDIFTRWREDLTLKEVVDYLLIQYENAIKAMQEEVIRPTDMRKHDGMPNMVESADIVKRLNKGYLRFVYDTTSTRLQQYFEEKKAKDDLNPIEEIKVDPATGEPTNDCVDFI